MRSSVTTCSHNLAPSVCASHSRPSTFFSRAIVTPMGRYRFDPHRARAHLHVDTVRVDDRIHRVERPGLPCLDLIDHRIGERRNQAGRHLRPVHLFQVRLDLAHRHAACIQRKDLVVEAGSAGLVFGDRLWLEVAVPITRDLDR